MNKKYIILAIVVLGVVALSIWSAKDKTVNINTTPAEVASDDVFTIPTSGEYCYGFIHEATEVEPYHVEEHVVLNFDGTTVTGTKTGTQSGPDMTNGYTGTLEGSVITNDFGEGIQFVYEYTVEGSTNRELEFYAVLKEGLVRQRWSLEEAIINDENILVPNFQGDPVLMPYRVEPCVE